MYRKFTKDKLIELLKIYANNMFVLWYGTKTSTYDTSKTIKGIRLFQNVNGKYKLYYSSFEDTEKVLNNESVNETQSLLLTNAINEIEHLKSLFLGEMVF